MGKACVHGLPHSCSDLSRQLDVKFPDPCEYNPDEARAAYGCEVHAAAELIVGANGKWRLCAACAALPAFKRFRRRIPIRKKAATQRKETPMGRRNEDTAVTCRIIGESANAYQIEQGDVQCQISYDLMRNAWWVKVDPNVDVTITIPRWLADDRGLE